MLGTTPLAAALLLASLQGVPDSSPRIVPKGDRLLGMSITEAQDGDFTAAVGLARGAGVQTTSLPVFWDDLETAPGVFAPSPNFLAIANAYYPALGMPLVLEVNPIDTNNLRLPPDLVGRGFDDPVVIARFQALLDWVFTQVPSLSLVGFVIGNEVDVWLGTDAAAWSAYETFFQAAAAHARSLRAGLRVGVKVTLDGLRGPAQASVLSLERFTDVVMLNHYPLEPDFTVQAPVAVRAAFDDAVRLNPGRVVWFTELGYPSGALCRSSEALQAEFVRQTFHAWDAHRDVVGLVEFVWQTDVSPAALSAFAAYYGLNDPVFLAYLGTLGLRRYPGSGSDKPAFVRLRKESRKRGW